MPALNQVDHKNCKTKGQLKNYLNNILRPALANHRLLNAALSQSVNNWETQLDLVDDDPPAKLTEPDKDLFVSPAFVHGHQELSNQYFESIEELSRRQVGSNAYGRTEKKMLRLAHELDKSSTSYDLKLQRYDQAYEKYQEENEDDSVYQERIAPYKQQLNLLRGQLRGFITTFNNRFPFDEAYRRDMDEDWDYGFRYKYEGYAPTQHGWFANVAGGTYFYDYARNRMQVHLHYNATRSKVDAVRTKLYGEEHGKKCDLNWGMIQHLTTTYVPNFDGAWHQV